MRRRASGAWIVLAACGFASVALATAARAGAPPEPNVPPRCAQTGLRHPDECEVYPRIARPMLYAAASGDAIYEDSRLRSRFAAHVFDHLVADPDDLASGNLRVRLYGFPVAVWIERRDIVRSSELRRVERCWPISRFGIENGDAPGYVIRVRQDGSGTFYSDGNRMPVHAWYLDGVYAVRQEGLSGDWHDWAQGNLDLATRTVLDRGAGRMEHLEDAKRMGPSCASGPVVGSLDAATWSAQRARTPRFPEELVGDWEPISKPCLPSGTMTVERRRITYALAPESSFDLAIRRAGWGSVLLEAREPRPGHVARFREITFGSPSSREPQILVEYGSALDASGHPQDKSVCWYARRKGPTAAGGERPSAPGTRPPPP